MWTPTHIKVTVHKARNLKNKGRSGDNDPYVVIHYDDQKFTTSVKTRNKIPEWSESCDLPIQSDFEKSVLRLSVHNRNLFSLDDYLGETYIVLKTLSVYDRPQSRWYALANRRTSRRSSGEDEDSGLGEVQVTVTFMVQSRTEPRDVSSGKLQRQRSLSFRSLANLVGGKVNGKWSSQSDLRNAPLTDLTERKCAVHSMLEMHDVSRSFHHLHISSSKEEDVFGQRKDQGVTDGEPVTIYIGENEEFNYCKRRSSESSVPRKNISNNYDAPVAAGAVIPSSPSPDAASEPGSSLRRRPMMRQGSLQPLAEESNEAKRGETMEGINNAKNSRHRNSCGTTEEEDCKLSVRATHKRHSYLGCGDTSPSPMIAAYRLNEIEHCIDDNRRKLRPSTPPPVSLDTHEEVGPFETYNRDDLIQLVMEQQKWINSRRTYVQDLEEYIDGLLIRVLETNQQSILQNPYDKSKNKRNDKNQKKTGEKINKKRILDLLKIWKK